MMNADVAVIDYGMGNLHSVASAVAKVAPGSRVEITGDRATIARAKRVIFPGVGAMRDCMAEIRRLEVDRVLAEVLAAGTPVLAVCVGLQALMEISEENGGVPCLGLFRGAVRGFAGFDVFEGSSLKVPHMGWNEVRQTRPHPLWQDIPDASRFYFVHSYCVQTDEVEAVVGSCHYGVEFNAALARGNLFAAQFHPEKSHTHGLTLVRNFTRWNGREE